VLRILLIGNYAADRQQSMQRYAAFLHATMPASRFAVDLVLPRALLAKVLPFGGELGKWLGHVDKLIIFPWSLLRMSGRYDVLHLCDHGNAAYALFLPKRRTLVTCHDCLAMRGARGDFAEVHVRWTGRIAQRLILAGLRRARHVVCVSEATRQDLLELTGSAANAVPMIPNVLTHPYGRMDPADATGQLCRLGISKDRPLLLHVGSNEWYKNRLGVLGLFKELVGREGFRDCGLVLVGEALAAEHVQFIGRHCLTERIIVREDIGNEALRALYSTAQTLLFPSLHEGFGWPIIEAQACGCLVVTSRREPMMSVAGSGAILVDPLDHCGAADEIERQWQRREYLIVQGYENVRRFDPDRFIEAYAELYERMVR
jgi:glycosyltransferase involved in cell wall biosynthesis